MIFNVGILTVQKINNNTAMNKKTKAMKLSRGLQSIVFILVAVISQAQQRPNIIIIVSDDHAYQTISAYGSKLMQTPGIDRIANEDRGERTDERILTDCRFSQGTIACFS